MERASDVFLADCLDKIAISFLFSFDKCVVSQTVHALRSPSVFFSVVFIKGISFITYGQI